MLSEIIKSLQHHMDIMNKGKRVEVDTKNLIDNLQRTAAWLYLETLIEESLLENFLNSFVKYFFINYGNSAEFDKGSCLFDELVKNIKITKKLLEDKRLMFLGDIDNKTYFKEGFLI